MTPLHTISQQPIGRDTLFELCRDQPNLQLSEESRALINNCRVYLDKKITTSQGPIYGINTGFGSLYDKYIPDDKLELLQKNLVLSHACGTGAELPSEIVRLMLFAKIRSLSYGYSGVQLSTVERLVDMYNEDVLPCVYEMGSLGASGDLAPLAHLSLPLIGEGLVYYRGERMESKEVLKKLSWEPLHFKAKEGLALLNGTQMMSAFGIWCIYHGNRLLHLSNLIGALSFDAFDGRPDPFDDRVHRIRPHHGQIKAAEEISGILAGSEIMSHQKTHVQDPYSFRCMPQVHGASMDVIIHNEVVFLTELNGVTDNPNIFPDDDVIISAGNFHGQPLAMALDFLAIAVAELGSISERRTYQLISGARNLPRYLVANPGIHSGLMIPQYTAASLVSRNKQLCTPASVDSIVSSNGQEDHVSMGANAATKAYAVLNNVYSILAIELITASQAIHFRRPLKTSPKLEDLINNFRSVVSFIESDRLLHKDIINAECFLKDLKIEW